MLTPVSGTENDDSNNTRKSKQFFFESFSHANRNDVHGTKFGRQYFQQQAESSKLLDIDDDSDIREMGVQITRSSVTGKTHVKEYK